MHHMDVNKTHRDKARRNLLQNAMRCLETILEAAPHKTAGKEWIHPPTAMGLTFNKYGFGSKYPTKFDMPLNKETEIKMT